MAHPPLLKLLRFLRLYLSALYKTLDPALAPRVQMLILRFDDKMGLEVLPHYSSLTEKLERVLPPLTRPLAAYLDSEHAYYQALFATLTKYDEKNDRISYYSGPRRHQRSVVLLRMTLCRSAYDQYERLKKDHPATSLLEALEKEVLVDIDTLFSRMASGNELLSLDYNDTLRRAAKRLLRLVTPERVWHATFEKLNEISALSYEQAESKGRIFMAPHNQPLEDREHLQILLTFTHKIPLSNSRHVRKLLEITGDSVGLLSDGESILGIARLLPGYDLSSEGLFTIAFLGSYRWELLHGPKRLLRVAFEKVALPQPKVDFRTFKQAFLCSFPGLSEERIAHFFKVMLEAAKQEKGALIVVTHRAEEEVIRLKNQGFTVTPKPVDPTLIRDLATIDGAILLDAFGQVHGIGVILDGMASEKGDPSRGPATTQPCATWKPP